MSDSFTDAGASRAFPTPGEFFDSITVGPVNPYSPPPALTDNEQGQADAEEAIQDFIDNFNNPEVITDTDPNSDTYLQAYYLDADGNKIVIADYSGFAGRLEDLANMSVPSLQDWMDEQGIEMGSIEALQALFDSQLEDIGTIDEEEMAEAEDYAASTFGLTSEEYNTMVNELTNTLADPASATGWTDEYRALQERLVARDIAEQSAVANRMVNNVMAATGSSTRALAAADNYTNNINNYAIKARTQLIEDELAAKMANVQSQQAMWGHLTQTGQMAKTEYLDRMMQAEATVLQGYAIQMDMVLKENAQYLDMYRADLQAIELSIDAIYKSIMAELGVYEALTSAVESHLTAYYDGIDTQLELMAADLGIWDSRVDADIAEQEATWNQVMDVLGLIAQGAGVLIGAG